MKDLIRHIKWFYQRRKYGFDDRDLWDLRTTIADFLSPRLEAFKKGRHSFPYDSTDEKWGEILDKMINSMDIIRKDELTTENYSELKEGLDFFREYFLDLWD